MKYQPEDKKAKQLRLKEIAAAKEAKQNPAPSKAPKVRPLARFRRRPRLFSNRFLKNHDLVETCRPTCFLDSTSSLVEKVEFKNSPPGVIADV